MSLFTPEPGCAFCSILYDGAPAHVLREWPDAVALTPLSPVAPGHALVVSRRHVRDAAEHPVVTGRCFQRAAELLQNLQRPANLVTSCGTVATQTVFHLHVHVVPRSSYDELCLPWDCQRSRLPAPGGPAVSQALADLDRSPSSAAVQADWP